MAQTAVQRYLTELGRRGGTATQAARSPEDRVRFGRRGGLRRLETTTLEQRRAWGRQSAAKRYGKRKPVKSQ